MAQRLVTVNDNPSGVSFFATRRGLPTPPENGLTSMLEPAGSVLRHSSAMVAPYTYQAVPCPSVENASVTGAGDCADAEPTTNASARVSARVASARLTALTARARP